MKEISIIIPVYNAENTLDRCINSILQQSYKEYEIILVNDASMDNSLSILKKYEKNERINIINLKENRGVSNARNIGVNKVVGKYIMFIDSDDWIEETYCEELHRQITEENVGLAICSWNEHNIQMNKCILHDNCIGEQTALIEVGELIKYYQAGLITPLWNKIFITDIIRKNRIIFDEKQKIGEDLKFVLEYLDKIQNTYKISIIGRDLYNYISGQENSLMKKYIYNIEYILDNMKSLKNIVDMQNSELSKMYWNYVHDTYESLFYSIIQNKKINSLKTIQKLISNDQFKEMMKNQNIDKIDSLYKYRIFWKIKKQLYKEKLWRKLNKNDKK